MTLALAVTWNPRGELERFYKLRPLFEQAYSGAAICFPPGADMLAVQHIQEATMGTGGGAGIENSFWRLVISPDWSWGRFLALQSALEFPASHIQYADMDRLLRWMETRPEEWLGTVAKIQSCDCLIVGRTQSAYATHPQSLIRTEAISNRLISFLLGQAMDVSAGSKGFSQAAAAFVIANSSPGHALGTDGEWPVLAQRGGYRIDYAEVEGLDWESADRYQDQAAGSDRQRQLAAAVDQDPNSWAWRVEVANEIVQCGVEAASRELIR